MKLDGYGRTMVTLDEQDALRFARKLGSDDVRNIYFECPSSWLNLFKVCYSGVGSLIIFGARPPDRATIKFLSKFAGSVVILQHAVNRSRSIREIPLGYFTSNFRKLILWVLYSTCCFLVSKLYTKKSDNTKVLVLYFSDEYLKEWEYRLDGMNCEFEKCPLPDPTKFGTEKDINICEAVVDYQLIDEPFNKTLGISKAEEDALLLRILSCCGSSKVHVKVHPRSRVGKFDISQQFVTRDCIYSNAKTIIGYKSGLLNFPFSSAGRLAICLEKNGIALVSKSVPKASEFRDSYIDYVQKKLRSRNI